MNDLWLELVGWMAFLQRPAVLLQVALLAVVVLGLVQLRRLSPFPPLGLLWRLPLSLLLLAGEGLIVLLLASAGQRLGLVSLAAQITLAWLGLQLLERQLLARSLSPAMRQLLVSRLLRPLFLLAVLLTLLDALGSLQDIAGASLGVWFGSEISVGRLSGVLLVLYVLLVGLELPAQALSRLMQRGLEMSEGSTRAFEQILRYVLFGLALIWALTRLGFDRTGMLAVAGGLSVGLGFGIKEVVSNIVSGLWLLIEGSVRPGEVLMHEGEVCQVRRLGPRAATLWRKKDNAELVVPNQDFFTTATTTYTRSDRLRRCALTLEVRRGWPPQQIVLLLEEVAAAQGQVLAQPPPRARLEAFGPERYGYALTFSIADPLRAAAVSSALRLAICRRFEQVGIDPPS